MPKQRRISKAAVGHAVLSVINCFLIIALLIFSIVLTLSSVKAGTFSIFGKSWYYYQSDVMNGIVERNELLIINRETPAQFQPNDLIAFYENDAKGTRVIQIARLQEVQGNQYLVSEAQGEPFILDSSTTVFIGQVTSHSKTLGKIVQQMRTKEGRKIFLGWSVSLLLFSWGLTLLLHVRRDRRLQLENSLYPDEPEYEEPYDDYDGEYDEAYDDEYDEDYPQEPSARFDRVPSVKNPLFTPQVRQDDIYDDYEYEQSDEIPQAVDEDNMNLIALSTESEDEEDADFDAIFREINRQINNQ